MTGNHSRILIPTEFVSPKTNSTGEYFFHIIERLLVDENYVKLIVPGTKDNRSAVSELRLKAGANLESVYIAENADLKGASIRKALHSVILTAKLWWLTRKTGKNGDTLFWGTNPTFLVLFLGLLLPQNKFRKILLCYDIFPDNLITISSNKLYVWMGKAVRPLFLKAYRCVDRVVVIGRCMKERLIEWGVPEDKILIASNWADESEVAPANSLNDKNETSESIEFQFLGNIGPLQGLELLLDAFKYVKSDKAAFSFYGRGAFTETLTSFIESNTSNVKVRFGGTVSRDKRNETLNACDVAIVSLDKRVTGLGVPSKTYFSLAVGKPIFVIAAENSEPARIVLEYGLGWVSSTDDPQELAQAIDTICENWTDRPSTSHIHTLFLNRFSKSTGTSVMSKAIVELN